MRKQRFLVLFALICLVALLLPVTVFAEVDDGFSENGYYYYRDGEMVRDEIIEHNGKLYAFDWNGWKYTNTEFWFDGYWYRAHADGSLYVNEWHKYSDGSLCSYYGADGKAGEDFVLIEGKWYFLNDGYPVRNDYVWSEDSKGWYYIAEDMTTYTAIPSEQWIKDIWGDWRYFSPDGEGYGDFVLINGQWFFLDWQCCMMCDQVVWSDKYQAYYALSENGEAHKELPSTGGWVQAFGNWYYGVKNEYYAGGCYYVSSEAVEIGGKTYFFHYNGQMAANEPVSFYLYDEELGYGEYVEGYADANGVVMTNGWYQFDNQWHYLKDGHELSYGVYKIGSDYYFFEYYLIETPGMYEYDGREYFISANSGKLLRNQWYYREICADYQQGWVYYGDDAAMVMGDSITLDGVVYAFDYNGVMIENTIAQYDGTAYLFNVGGAGVALNDGWHTDPETQEWVYVKDGCLVEGIQKVDGVYYSFYNGRMATESWNYGSINDVWGYYLFGADGSLIKQAGWHLVYGEWFYVEENGTLAMGWKYLGGQWFYFDPYMLHDCLFYDYDENCTYVMASSGAASRLQGDGVQRVTFDNYGSQVICLAGGKPVTDSWYNANGSWYYFNENGFAYANGVYTIKKNLHLFNESGVMMSGGWVFYKGYWYYADPTKDSALVTGIQVLDGVSYIFSSNGQMYTEKFTRYNGKLYHIAPDGHILNTMNNGWHQIDGDWYYVEDNYLVSGTRQEINDKNYVFDYDGKMMSGGLCKLYTWTAYIANDGGELLTGWHQIDGKWMYAYPEYYYVATDTYEYINGKQYWFDENGYLLTGTFTYWGVEYTTDADGAVISKKEVEIADGWYLRNNEWHYVLNGNDQYTGWVGNYYIDHGYMVYDSIIEYNGKHYYLQPNGLCLMNGWANTELFYDSFVLAKADGSLYCGEWAQVGGAWYYFDGHDMVSDCIILIDDTYHEFNEDGIWIGEYTFDDLTITKNDYADGWQLIDGEWYYFQGGYACMGEMYISGNWYYFDYWGEMAASEIVNTNGRYRYYDASGVAVNYVGWQLLDGNWYYFNADGTVYTGLLNDGGTWYYLYVGYNEDDDEGARVSRMVTNEFRVINGAMYYFNESGASTGAIRTDGWYTDGEEWVYILNGRPAQDYTVIDGVPYYFSNGYMLYDTIVYINGDVRYINKAGVVTTQQGWYSFEYNDITAWIYVGANGEVYEYGVYIIDGVEYTFSDGFLIS